MKYEHDEHKLTEYDRPSTKYRCGRAARWGQPCWQGPDQNRKCGGTSECTPVLRDDRYYCQRPESAGGACSEGPLPDGQCAHTHLPCRPRVSSRQFRGRLALFGVLVIVILVALFSNRDGVTGSDFMINPGKLSSAHSGFPVTDRCENCHQSHQLPASAWLLSAFKQQDMTQQCVQCHAFDGEATAPHNGQFETREITTVACSSCHSEHKGAGYDISKVANRTCGNCHEKSFTQFAEHTEFPANYPHQQPQNIFFDHARHLSEYFVEDKWVNKPGRDAKLAENARSSCSFCHQIENAQRDIPIRKYDIICAGCHEQQIRDRAMTILTSDEVAPAFMQLLISNKDADNDEEPDIDDFTKQLIDDLAGKGMKAVYERLEGSVATEMTQRHLFLGLDSSLIKHTAEQWLDEESLDTDDDTRSGWQAGENDDGADAVFYRPEGHADDVMRSWIDLYLRGDITDGDDVLDGLLDVEDGPGACGKCHGSMIGRSQRHEKLPLWSKTQTQARIYTPGFSHRPHIDLLGKSEGCDACHKLSDDADYPAYFKQGGSDIKLFQSSFEGVKKETCTKCHNQERIPDDCQLCHVYHAGAGFKFEYQQREMKVINHD
jgi:predicted CXXCH cytochrome family protein